jgi:hypothetical protein
VTTIFKNTFLVLRIGVLVSFGLPLTVGAGDTGRERSESVLTTLDSSGDVGRSTSATIGADGLGLISYRDFANHTLKVAHCSNPACVPDLHHP